MIEYILLIIICAITGGITAWGSAAAVMGIKNDKEHNEKIARVILVCVLFGALTPGIDYAIIGSRILETEIIIGLIGFIISTVYIGIVITKTILEDPFKWILNFMMKKFNLVFKSSKDEQEEEILSEISQGNEVIGNVKKQIEDIINDNLPTKEDASETKTRTEEKEGFDKETKENEIEEVVS